MDSAAADRYLPARVKKEAVVKKIIERLQADLELYFKAARAAHFEATHEQSKAENKYDTRGLEASYLARGQSKQAGARTTVDFGACRDLSGRRLRHVNDEIKLRLWRDARAALERGDERASAEAELAALKTPSGIRNWHLAVPGWSEHGGSANTNKGRRAAERQLHNEVRGYRAREGAAKDAMERRRME